MEYEKVDFSGLSLGALLDVESGALEKKPEGSQSEEEIKAAEEAKAAADAEAAEAKRLAEEDEDGGKTATVDSEEEEEDFYAGLAKSLGFELAEDATYDDSEEGLLNFTKDAARATAEGMLSNLFSQFPEVQKHLDYAMDGGKSEDFYKTFYRADSYEKIELKEDDSDMQKKILTAHLKSKGMDDEFISETLENYEDSDRLYARSLTALNALKQEEKASKEALIAKQAEAKEAERARLTAHYETISNTIEKATDFGGVTITQKDKGKFFDYLTKRVGPNGETQKELDLKNTDLEQSLVEDYIRFKGGITQFTNKKKETKKTQSIRERLAKSQKPIGKGGSQAPGGGSSEKAEFDLEMIHQFTNAK